MRVKKIFFLFSILFLFSINVFTCGDNDKVVFTELTSDEKDESRDGSFELAEDFESTYDEEDRKMIEIIESSDESLESTEYFESSNQNIEIKDNEFELTDKSFQIIREEFEGIPFGEFVINGDAKLLFFPILFRKFLKLCVSGNKNLANNKGNTLLHMAAYFCEEWCVKLCLFYGIDVNAKNNLGATPLDFVVSIDNNYEQAGYRLKIANILKKKGGKTAEELS